MWFKLDDGFATHPKILAAGFIAMGIQLRALCYASQNKTDGFIHHNAIPLLLIGLEHIGIEYASIGDGTGGQLAGMGMDADEIDWPAELVKYGLWEPREGGYYVHDYLEWNLSKKQYESIKSKLSKAGRKGMKSRWKQPNQGYNQPNNSPNNESITSPSTSRESLSSLHSSSRTPNLKSKGKTSFPDDWKLNGEVAEAWKKFPINVFVEFAAFKDHALTHDRRCVNWDAAFRNWCRKAIAMKEK